MPMPLTLPLRSLALTMALSTALALAAIPTGQARPWKPSPEALAQDYLMLSHKRSTAESVQVLWVAPPMLPRNDQSNTAREVLEDYILLAVIHANTQSTGMMDFVPVANLTLRTLDGTVLQPLDRESLPPTTAGILTVFEQVFTRNLGPLGRGTHWFVFDGKAVPSCGKGGFVVPYAGEEYLYETPVPGC
ncbi:MAG: hypothetical protein H6907_06745 [Hyphomicrobiales bacterium]|nr:hypothetical protein [Hyphomicrobiales bacterium]